MTFEIRVDDLRGPEIAALLQEHLDDMAKWSPPESIHALDLERLRKPEITFWTVWEGGDLVGCGAIRQLDAGDPIRGNRGQGSVVICRPSVMPQVNQDSAVGPLGEPNHLPRGGDVADGSHRRKLQAHLEICVGRLIA